NDVVRVLEYRDTPGAATAPHRHPDSVMYTLSGFSRRLRVGGATRDVTMRPGEVHWLPAQVHRGENVGATDSHALFVELKHSGGRASDEAALGPSTEAPS